MLDGGSLAVCVYSFVKRYGQARPGVVPKPP